jgi:type VI secretion system protein ImpC
MTTQSIQASQKRTATADELVAGGDLSAILNEIVTRLCPTADETMRATIQESLLFAIEKAEAAGSDLEEHVQQLDLWLADICSSLQSRLDAQVDAILHNSTFQEYEARWKALEQVASEISRDQEATVLSASLPELRNDAKKAGRKLDRSQLYRSLYKDGIGVGGKTPFAAVFLGQYFTTSNQDVELLKKLSDYGADLHAPVFTNADVSIFKEESFRDLPSLLPEDLEKRLAPEPAWGQLRQHENSRYLGVALPRVLGRLPYHPTSNSPGEAYSHYEEKISSPNDYLYTAASYCLARQVLASFKRDALPHNITGQTSGGKVEGLVAELKKFSTEALIDYKQEKTLSVDLGFIPLMGVSDSAEAYFAAVPSVQKSKNFGSSADQQDKTTNFARGTQLDNLLLISRFAHCITAMQRAMVGERLDGNFIKEQLESWLKQFRYPTGMRVTPERAREYPIKEYRVDVRNDPSRPGWYTIDVQITPIDTYQGADIALSFAGEGPQKE